ncbi:MULTISPECIES: PilT/PilU family type 4a pilus ATPase [unclassified Guyparkeria]|uniref:PilT/PilU family type 4a pilus ATPase n=1 Tax=unclassified Guyparkeria TaxID=2626246 RepID=UPI0007333B82|nr:MULTISPECIES: PilT/PilU family type 4a pilus ATPase [unclassified Guyparkeria]KTG17439.1 type IV pili twitching motility protein PilT [Guyparkeria sp. XI15]OAE87416.1 type IV pili twitching motility protein PilT [Guyparkeria sp. WRN-7]
MSQLSLEPYLKLLADKEGSDLYFSSGTTPAVKIQGEMRFIGKDRLRSGQVEELARSVLNQHQIDDFLETLELNVALSRPGIGRFRMNVFMQRGEWSLVIRFIQAEIPRAADLNLPMVVEDLITERRGLILVVGATGSGKSTTLASMIDYRAEARPGHILTVEDPMEYAFRHRNSVVNQREVGVDTRSYAAALKEALREAPDVIMIGEVRDRATMEHALAYADTGHLCISTLHATNANQALDRIIRFFPSESRDQLLMDLSLNLKAIISQRLIIGSGGKRLPAVEILINTPLVSDLIKRGEIDAIKESMEKNTSSGAMTFDMSILELHKKGLITREEALANADSRSNMEWLISFGGGQDELKAAAADSSGIKSDASDSDELPPLE